MWSIGVFDLGLTSDQFWSMTPAQIWALSQRKELDSYYNDRRAAIVASTIANVNRPKGKRAYPIADFMPKYSFDKQREQTPDDMLKIFQGLIGAGKEK